MPVSKILNALENNSLAASFMHLKWREDSEDDCTEVGESKVGIGLQESTYYYFSLSFPKIMAVFNKTTNVMKA